MGCGDNYEEELDDEFEEEETEEESSDLEIHKNASDNVGSLSLVAVVFFLTFAMFMADKEIRLWWIAMIGAIISTIGIIVSPVVANILKK